MQSKKQLVLSYFVPGHNTTVPLVFAFSEIVEAKSIVAKVKWVPDESQGDSQLNLSWSDALDSHFTYLPRATRPGVKDGPTLMLEGPGTIEISFASWPTRKPVIDSRISGAYVRTHSSLNGQVFSGLQRILEVGMTR